ncbi:two-component regulator propeller domain-containing protein [Salinivirga cyanobacteriivorans]
MKYVLVFLAGLCVLPYLNAQKSYRYNFDRYTNEQGLSQGQVFDISQDKTGRIWIATYSGGITILDGQKETYLSVKDGMPSYSTTSLFLDKKERMWIGTANGPCYYDGYSVRTPVISEPVQKLFVWDIAADQNGKIWLATDQGIWHIKNDTVYVADPAIMQYPFYKISKQPEKNQLWFCSGIAGPMVLQKDSLTKAQISITDDVLIEDLFFTSEAHVFVASTMGLFDCKVEGTKLMVQSRKIHDHHAITMEIDKAGRLWVGTDEAGLFIFDENGNIKNITAYQGIGFNRIYKIFKDSQQNIWIGTDGAGVSIFKGFNFAELRIEELYQPSFVMDVHIDKAKNMWVATEGQGLIKISENKHEHFTTDNGLSSNFTNEIVSSENGEVYVATNTGITVFKNGKINYLRKPAHLVTNLIESLMLDEKGQLWAGTFGQGLQCVNTQKLFSSANGLSSDYIWDILQADDKRIFVATDQGVNIIKDNKVVDTINKEDGLLNEHISSLLQDRYGNFWFAAEGGLAWYNNDLLKYYPISELANSHIFYSIIEDKYGRILLGTENGIVLLNTDKNGVIYGTHQYSRNTGFFGIECNSNAVTKNEKGEIFWGTVNGVTKQNPTKEIQTRIVADPFIRSIQLSENKDHLHGYADSVAPWFNLPVNLHLPYSKKNVTINYGAPEFVNQDNLLYRYKLEGLDETWSKPGEQTQVSYNHLSSGTYTFRVQTLHSDYMDKPAGEKTYTFTIDTPLYQTWWFRIIMSVTLVTIVLLLWNYRIYALRKRKTTLQKLVRERTMQLSRQKNQLEKANKEIRQSAQLKEQFLANTSHEMRTPLNVVIGYSNLMLNARLDKQHKRYMENIRSSGEHLKVIINDLLDLSKIEANKLTLNNTSFNYRRIIINTFNVFRIEAENKGLKAELNIQRPIHKIIGDPVRLTQILSNLLRNAVKFTEEGFIGITTKEEKIDEKNIVVHIQIKDSGIGIPDNKINQIFESFTQVKGNLTRKYGGTGLGLAIVKKLVELHDGDITVDSKENKGTVFNVSLPYQISTENETPLIEDYKIRFEKILENTSILIVDDNEINLSLAIETLQKFNSSLNIEVAYNGKEAIEILSKKDFDLVIMDIQMPVMDGYEATKLIRNREDHKRDIPILGMTAHAMKDERTRCLDLGMNEYLSKPFSPADLLNKIKKILDISPSPQVKPNIPTKEGNNDFKTIDIRKIKAIVGDSMGKEIKYLKLLQKNAPDFIQKIDRGIQKNDFRVIKVSAHSLKSTFRYYGAEDLMNLSKQVELLAEQAHDQPKIERLLKEIQEKWANVEKELTAYFSKQN